MNIRNIFKSKKKKVVLQEEPVKGKPQQQPIVEEDIRTLMEDSFEKKEVSQMDAAEKKLYIRENCEKITESSRQLEDFKMEYQAVTDYLTDTQKIDLIPEGAREKLDEAAKKIVVLMKERMKYQNAEIRITNEQYNLIEQYEDDIPDEVKKISEKESYHKALKKDMSYLAGEKKMLLYQRDMLAGKHKELNLRAMVIASLTAVLFILLGGLSIVFDVDMTIPFILAVVFGLVCGLLTYKQARENQIEFCLTDRKLNRAITLANTVKIKYINNQLSIDYSYHKFGIKSAANLTEMWEEYKKAKNAADKYKENTEELNYYNEVLLKELKMYQIADPDVWLHQSNAIYDPKEMVEIRHRLNVRRQKLRDRMEYNNRMMNESMENIQSLVKNHPDTKADVISMLKKHRIQFEI